MLAYYAKRSPGEDFETLPAPIKKGMWVDGGDITRDETNTLSQDYDLDNNILLDVLDANELPRVEYADEDTYVFLRLPRLSKSSRVITAQLLCVVTPQHFFTLSSDETLPPAMLGLKTLPTTTEQTQTLLLAVLASVVSRFEVLIQHTAQSIHTTASRLRSHEITNSDFIHFVTVEANLNDNRMNLNATSTVAQRLHENSRGLLTEEDLEALDDIILHIQQLLVEIDRHANSVESIRNAYGTVANNTLNKRMKTLTVFTVLITLPNLVFGMYGMNVALPYMDQPWAFFMVLGIGVSVVVLTYTIAKRLRIF